MFVWPAPSPSEWFAEPTKEPVKEPPFPLSNWTELYVCQYIMAERIGIAQDIRAYLDKGLLRFITCGSVDEGKSTLIGRLLYDSKIIFEDQLAALEADSKRAGTQGQEIDFALLVEGLAAERDQGITIDVAYRCFATEKRKFIVAGTPVHERYIRNMAVAVGRYLSAGSAHCQTELAGTILATLG